MSILNDLLPASARVAETSGKFVLKKNDTIYVAAEMEFLRSRLVEAAVKFGIELLPGDDAAGIVLERDPALGKEAWTITIEPERIWLKGMDRDGLLYAVMALVQLLGLASARGPEEIEFPCGEIQDFPRFHHRSLMLDSARHFQPIRRIKEVLELMAEMRLNHFHWHLTDNQGWRYQSTIYPKFKEGNRIINSVHYYYYLDYPSGGNEPRSVWMPTLPEEAVYLSEPCLHLGDRVTSQLLGPECCLWTEIVPEWRVLKKLRSRIYAFAEVAWSHPERREWSDYIRRKAQLQQAGLLD